MPSFYTRKTKFIRVIDATVRSSKWIGEIDNQLKQHPYGYSQLGCMKLYLEDNVEGVDKLCLLGTHPVWRGDEVVAYIDCKETVAKSVFAKNDIVRKLDTIEAPLALQKLVYNGGKREVAFTYQLYSDSTLRSKYDFVLNE